ncbi:protein-tyrosine phosphatase-like protein, partial [Protomyces lactucae-debilis]
DLLDHFQDTFRFIQYGLDEGHRILVHCEQGISRSATVLAAFVMKSERYHPSEAIRYIQRFRPIADPNPGFRKQL